MAFATDSAMASALSAEPPLLAGRHRAVATRHLKRKFATICRASARRLQHRSLTMLEHLCVGPPLKLTELPRPEPQEQSNAKVRRSRLSLSKR